MKHSGEAFDRKPLRMSSQPMQKILMESMKELDLEKNAIKMGIGKTGATAYQYCTNAFSFIMGSSILFFLGRNQIWPLLKPRFTKIEL